MMHRKGHMSPWAELALYAASGPAAERIVRASPLTKLVGGSRRGPWVAQGPAGRIEGADIVAVVNAAAGMVVL